MVKGATVCADPQKVKATNLKKLRGWFGMCNHLSHFVPGLGGNQINMRTLLKDKVVFLVSDEIREEFEETKKGKGENILLNSFSSQRRSFVVTDALPTFCCRMAVEASGSSRWCQLQSRLRKNNSVEFRRRSKHTT